MLFSDYMLMYDLKGYIFSNLKIVSICAHSRKYNNCLAENLHRDFINVDNDICNVLYRYMFIYKIKNNN